MNNNKNEIKESLKKAFFKMMQIPTICCMLIVSGAICYYTVVFYNTNTLVFHIQDTKILIGLSIATLWSVTFCGIFMKEMMKQNKVIIEKDDIIIDLLHQVKNQNNNTNKQNSAMINQTNTLIEKTNNIETKINDITEATETIIEQNDYIVEQESENYDKLIKFHKNTRKMSMGEVKKLA